MFRKILDWIIKLLLSIYNNKTAREMAMSALKTAAVEFKDAAVKTLQAAREANSMNCSGAEKYEYVVQKVKSEYAEIPQATLNQLIENAVGLLNDPDFDSSAPETEEDEEQIPQV